MSTSMNIFLDVEAGADSDGSNEDLEESPCDREFIQEDHVHHSDDEESQFRITRPATRAEDEEDEEIRLRSLLTRARARAVESQSNLPLGSIYGIDVHGLQENELLWEIGCKVGSEQATVSIIQKRTLHSSSFAKACASALNIFCPGRIYVKARYVEQVTRLSRSFEALNSLKVRPVPQEDVVKLLNTSLSTYVHGSWARVRGGKSKWSRYVGDTGLITEPEGRNESHLALIPRIAPNGAEEGQSRPPHMLVSRRGLEKLGTVKDELYGRFVWKGQLFSAEGFLLVDLDDISTVALLDPLPSSAELAVFRSTSLLSAEQAAKTEEQMAQAHINIGDRVKVVSGPYLNLIGEVKGIKENEVSIFLPSQDIVEDMANDTVRADFRVADHVRIIDGQHQGLVGWVIAVFNLERKLRVLDVEAAVEATVSMVDVEFHHSSGIIGLKPREQYPKWGKLGEQNPNDVYTSKRVMVIGSHELKGYKGYIKSTTPDGYAFLQLDTRLQQSVAVELVYLACLTHQDTNKRPFKDIQLLSQSLEPAPRPSSLAHSPDPIHSASTPALTPNLVGLTPAWDSSDSFHMQADLSPAWDPSSRSPCASNSIRPIHWLDDPGLQHLRLKLITTGSTTHDLYFEFLGIENDLVKVRDKANIRFLTFDSVSPLPPTSQGELVTPTSGEMQGVYFKVIQIMESICVVRKPGTKPTKKHPDTEFALTELIQVYPAFR